jgi:hypothetical protein
MGIYIDLAKIDWVTLKKGCTYGDVGSTIKGIDLQSANAC